MSVDASGALRLAAYLLVADGLAALYLGGLLGPLGLGMVGAAVVASWWQERLRAPLRRIRRGDTIPALIAAAASALDLVYFAESVLDGLVHLLLFLLLYRLFTRATLRDARDIGFLCFFLLAAATPVTFDVGFVFVFVAFLVVSTWLLMLRHVLTELQLGGPSTRPSGAEPSLGSASGLGRAPAANPIDITPAPRTIPGRRLLALSAGASAATLLVTAALFFVIPRIGQAALPLRAKMGRMVSGFSERVALGSFGEIELDSAVAMRVHVSEETPHPETLAPLRWRGIALDRFDGRAWTRDETERAMVRRSSAGSFEIARPRGGGLLVAQEIYLEPLGSDVVFGATRMLRLIARTDAVMLDDGGTVSVASAGARLRYVVESELEPAPSGRVRPRREPLAPAARARYLQLPAQSPRVAELAGRVTAGSRDQYEAAMRLTGYLGSQYRYSRALERRTDLPPVEEFLFSSHSGNCEYFAAALAVMLRTLGIPARVVNGFQRGEWNPYGSYFMVRLLDAHSWVEAHVDGTQWVTLDPSPRVGGALVDARGPVNLYLDSLRMRWYRYVVNWSLQDQVVAAVKVRRAASIWTPSLAWLRNPRELPRLSLAIVAIVAVVVVVARQLRARGGADAPTRAIPPFYTQALEALARRRLRPEASETAREFAARVAVALPSYTEPLALLTNGYERVRFGDVPLSLDEVAALDLCADGLGRLPGPR